MYSEAQGETISQGLPTSELRGRATRPETSRGQVDLARDRPASSLIETLRGSPQPLLSGCGETMVPSGNTVSRQACERRAGGCIGPRRGRGKP
jgi:hypothetical protein